MILSKTLGARSEWTNWATHERSKICNQRRSTGSGAKMEGSCVQWQTQDTDMTTQATTHGCGERDGVERGCSGSAEA
jgi:hypothetical protein